MSGEIDLKAYLMAEYVNPKHKSITLMDLYASDNKYFESLFKKNKIRKEAVSFFRAHGREVIEASSIPTEAFKNLKYERLIDDYLENITKENAVVNQPVWVGPLHCINDQRILNQSEIKKGIVVSTGKKYFFPVYQCPDCKSYYTSISTYKDLKLFSFGGVKYTNILLREDRERHINWLKSPHWAAPGSKCIVYGPRSAKPIECQACGKTKLANTMVIGRTKKGKPIECSAKVCLSCETYYSPYSLCSTYKYDWTVVNENEMPAFEEDARLLREEKESLREQRKAEEKARIEAKRQREEKKKLEEAKRIKKEAEIKYERIKKEAEEKAARLAKERLEIHRAAQRIIAEESRKEQKKNRNHITVKDFVVRRNVLKCRKKDHKLRNIDAVVNIITNTGNLKEVKVSAGYCPDCNTYFIMESTFQYLKIQGVLVCRVTDEQTYLDNLTYVNGMQLAQESVLHQYGYTVSKQTGLTAASRHKILEILVDNGVLTRSEIIGYLDFFINQRKRRKNFEDAIDKWESDRNYISAYRSGNYEQVGVSSLYRNYKGPASRSVN